jgi:hypothetical protein
MSVGYKLLYAVGFTPWQQIAALPAVTERFSELLDREEAGREPLYGRVLDLGAAAGSGRSHWRGAAGRSRESTCGTPTRAWSAFAGGESPRSGHPAVRGLDR